jgi:hypothetical protein
MPRTPVDARPEFRVGKRRRRPKADEAILWDFREEEPEGEKKDRDK